MFMRITWGRVRPGGWDEYKAAYDRVVMAHAADIPGLQARWLVHDQDDADTGYAVSLWRTSEDLTAYEQSAAYTEILEALQPFFVDDFRTNRCEVDFVQEFS